MKRWNWPTTILYIKHKKANLKQRCSKLVGKKRKAPSEGWSGGLNCPFGTGEEMHWHVPLGASAAAGPRHYTPGEHSREGPAAPARGRLHRPELPQGSRAGYSFKKLSRGERSPVSPNHGGPALPGTRCIPPPRGCTPPTPPAAPAPAPPGGTGHRGAQRKAARVL